MHICQERRLRRSLAVFVFVTFIIASCYVVFSNQDFSKMWEPGNTMKKESCEPVDTKQGTPNSTVKLHTPDQNVKLPIPYQNVKLGTPDLLDLDPEELFNRTVIITGFSDNHFTEVKGMLGSAQKYLPHTKIIAYNLGLSKKNIAQAKRFCNVVELRKFDFSKYPPHVAELFKYTWKPIVIQEALQEFDIIFWADASARFQRDPRIIYPYLKQQHGFIANILSFDSELMTNRTNPMTLKELGVDKDKYSKDMGHVPQFETGRIFIVNTTLLQEKLIKPWVACALRPQCLAPDKSTTRRHHHGPLLYTHFFDQTAMSILLYKNMYDAFTKDNDRSALLYSVVSVSRTSLGWKTVKYCPK